MSRHQNLKEILTTLQFAVLTELYDGELSGKTLRAALRKSGVPLEAQVFYLMMKRLMREKLVEGRYDMEGGKKSRFYRMTVLGLLRWEKTSEFYLKRAKILVRP